MTPSPGPISPHNAGGPPRVIQGCFPGGRPRLVLPSPAPSAPVRPQCAGSPPGPPGLAPGPDHARPSGNRRLSSRRVRPGWTTQPIHPKSATIPPGQPQAGDAFALPPGFALRPRGAGQQLPEPIQKKMEAFFNTSFADVRVHIGNEAPSIGALAFTHGADLHFAPGQYNPHSTRGQQLIGHELTHVVQQRAGRVRSPLGSGIAVVQDPVLEAEAECMGIRATTFQGPVQAKMTGPDAPRGAASGAGLSGSPPGRHSGLAPRLERPEPRSLKAILPASSRRPSPPKGTGAVQLMQGGSGSGWLLDNWAFIMTFGILAWLLWVYVSMTKRKALPRQVFEQVTTARQDVPVVENSSRALTLVNPVATVPVVDQGPRMVNPDEVILLPPPAHMVPFMLQQRQVNPVSLSNELVMSFVVRRNPQQIRLFLGEFCQLSTTGNELVAYRQRLDEPQRIMRRILHQVELICDLHSAVLSRCKSSQSLQVMTSHVDLFCTFVAVHDMGTELKEVAARLKHAVRKMTRKLFKLSEKALDCIAAEKSPLGRLSFLLDCCREVCGRRRKRPAINQAPQGVDSPAADERNSRTGAQVERTRQGGDSDRIEEHHRRDCTPVVNTPTAIVNPIDLIPVLGGYTQIANHTQGNFAVEVRVDWRKVYLSTSHGRKIAADPAMRTFYEQAMGNGYIASTDTGTSGVKKEPNLYIVKISYPDAQSSPLSVDNNISLIARSTDSGGPQNTLRLTFDSAEKRHG